MFNKHNKPLKSSGDKGNVKCQFEEVTWECSVRVSESVCVSARVKQLVCHDIIVERILIN